MARSARWSNRVVAALIAKSRSSLNIGSAAAVRAPACPRSLTADPLYEDLAHGTWCRHALCAAELCAIRGEPVRLKPRGCADQRHDGHGQGGLAPLSHSSRSKNRSTAKSRAVRSTLSPILATRPCLASTLPRRNSEVVPFSGPDIVAPPRSGAVALLLTPPAKLLPLRDRGRLGSAVGEHRSCSGKSGRY